MIILIKCTTLLLFVFTGAIFNTHPPILHTLFHNRVFLYFLNCSWNFLFLNFLLLLGNLNALGVTRILIFEYFGDGFIISSAFRLLNCVVFHSRGIFLRFFLTNLLRFVSFAIVDIRFLSLLYLLFAEVRGCNHFG